MIIQNLHKKNRRKIKEARRHFFLSLFFFLFYFLSLKAQDSIPPSEDVSESDNIQFQENFFKALSNKAIFNYQKAIENLEKCNELEPNNKAVLFELSKNYVKLGRNNEALEYIKSALEVDNENIWLLEHKVYILRKIAAFDEAIEVQEKIADKYPKKKRLLVFLHLQNRDIPSAKEVLSELKKSKLLNARLRLIQEKLEETKSPKPTEKKEQNTIANTDLRANFEKEKSFNNLKLLLNKLSSDNDNDLLKYSEQGLALFPAQPFVYFMNGKALNNKSQFKKAIQSLQNGIDFVIDNNEIEAKFYLEIARAYEGLNNPEKVKTYKNKAAKVLK
ncbi:tetratricopeptide repeat protein [uncultured Tenacibaculum sp.]|uniref:tetratricopeptide repeat protein n=1 Tax=uncultured Tenacibaculum sp. TaxID=174713 RepID=UPI002603DD95|nr:tetratricopeptide repeat protein [uncultured Tenacibaculum sp.]